MRERVFADSFYLIALLNSSDQHHDSAVEAAQELAGAMIWTTDWVLLETADACCYSPDLRQSATRWIRSSFDGEMTVVIATPELWQKTLSLFERHSDKQWSLTDCLSFIVMRDNGITKALTGDRHFVQAGFDALLR